MAVEPRKGKGFSGAFPVTRWSLVLSASEEGADALEQLCELYWRPVYGFLRRSGYGKQDAEDLTQTFLVRFVKGGSFPDRETVKGKLRSYLLGALKRHLIDYQRQRNAAKRGSGQEMVPLASSEKDFEDAEYRYAEQPVDEVSPDVIFDQSWVLELLERTHAKLRRHYSRAGKEKEYELLKPVLVARDEVDYEQVAAELKVSRSSARVFAMRLRRTFRAALKEEVAETVESREQVDEELRELLQVFSTTGARRW